MPSEIYKKLGLTDVVPINISKADLKSYAWGLPLHLHLLLQGTSFSMSLVPSANIRRNAAAPLSIPDPIANSGDVHSVHTSSDTTSTPSTDGGCPGSENSQPSVDDAEPRPAEEDLDGHPMGQTVCSPMPPATTSSPRDINHQQQYSTGGLANPESPEADAEGHESEDSPVDDDGGSPDPSPEIPRPAFSDADVPPNHGPAGPDSIPADQFATTRQRQAVSERRKPGPEENHRGSAEPHPSSENSNGHAVDPSNGLPMALRHLRTPPATDPSSVAIPQSGYRQPNDHDRTESPGGNRGRRPEISFMPQGQEVPMEPRVPSLDIPIGDISTSCEHIPGHTVSHLDHQQMSPIHNSQRRTTQPGSSPWDALIAAIATVEPNDAVLAGSNNASPRPAKRHHPTESTPDFYSVESNGLQSHSEPTAKRPHFDLSAEGTQTQGQGPTDTSPGIEGMYEYDLSLGAWVLKDLWADMDLAIEPVESDTWASELGF